MNEIYMSSGFCHTPQPNDPHSGSTEMTLYNPSSQPVEALITAYFSVRPPFQFQPVFLEARKNITLNFPEFSPEIFENCGFWGARIACKHPLILNTLSGSRIQAQKPFFSGGWTSFPGTKLDKTWRFPDGLWLEWYKFYNGDLSKSPWPFNECEDYLILNPTPEDARVELKIMYHHREHDGLIIHIPAERIFVWNNMDKVGFKENYTIKVVSNQPVTASAVRYIYGLHGIDEWGIQVHNAMLGIPGEFTNAEKS
jgi:hypothetical protein